MRKSQRYSKTSSKTKNIEIKEEPKKNLSNTKICEIYEKSENEESKKEDLSNKSSIEESKPDDKKNCDLENQKTVINKIPAEKCPG